MEIQQGKRQPKTTENVIASGTGQQQVLMKRTLVEKPRRTPAKEVELLKQDSPEIEVGIDGQKVSVVVDTGAPISALSGRLYKSIHPKWNFKCENESPLDLIGLGSEEPLPAMGVQSVALTFGNVTISHQVMIIDDFAGSSKFTMLVGQDINRHYQATLSESKKTNQI